MNKDLYDRIEQLAKEVNENWKTVAHDKMSIIIGIADNEERMVRELCVTGVSGGLHHMLAEILYGLETGSVAEDELNEIFN